MHGSFRTLVNPATSSKAPLPSEDIRAQVREVGRIRLDLSEASQAGDWERVAILSRTLEDGRRRLREQRDEPDRSPEDVRLIGTVA